MNNVALVPVVAALSRGKYVWSINWAWSSSRKAHVVRTVRSAAASCTRDHLGHRSLPCISSSSSSSSSYTPPPSPLLLSSPLLPSIVSFRTDGSATVLFAPMREHIYYIARNYGTLCSSHAHTADHANNLPYINFCLE